MATNKPTQMSRQAGRAPRAANPLVTLETRTTTEAVRAATPAGLNVGNNFTGQYLYDRFIGDSTKEDQTKMDIVRQMVKAMDAKQFGKVIGDFVDVAKGFRDNAVTAAKAAGGYDEKNPPISVREPLAKLRTARAHQTTMRIAYGALTVAAEQFAKIGGTEQTGFLLVRELGKKALEMAGLNWDGTKAEPAPTPEQKQAQARVAAEAQAMVKMQQANPRKEGEERAAYFDRIDRLVTKELKAQQAAAHAEHIKALAAQFKQLAGDELDEVLDVILNAEAEPETPAAGPDVALH